MHYFYHSEKILKRDLFKLENSFVDDTENHTTMMSLFCLIDDWTNIDNLDVEGQDS